MLKKMDNWEEVRKIGKKKFILILGIKDFLLKVLLLYIGWFLSILWKSSWSITIAFKISFLENYFVHIIFIAFSLLSVLIGRNNQWEKQEEEFKLKP